MKNRSGITLIAMAITIIVLLILAGVSIATLTGENGILTQTENAKEKTEIAEEKEIVQISTVQTMGKNKHGNILENEFQEALDKNSREGNKAFIIDSDSEVFKVKFDSDRYYEVTSNGDVSDAIKKEEIAYAGDLTKNETCDGSEGNPFQINCIEDLVAFSQNVKNGNTYEGLYIKLMRDLDFNSIFSYNNHKTTEYDEYLGGDGTTELKTQLSERGKGFLPIGYVNSYNTEQGFKGTFDGNNCIIKNIYIRIEYEEIQYYKTCGLFSYIRSKATIKNLTLGKGKIYSTNVNATGGICGQNSGKIINCINKADVFSDRGAGGIAGRGARTF